MPHRLAAHHRHKHWMVRPKELWQVDFSPACQRLTLCWAQLQNKSWLLARDAQLTVHTAPRNQLQVPGGRQSHTYPIYE